MPCPILPNTVAAHVLAGVGLLVVSKFVCGVLLFFYRKFLRAPKDLTKLGKWAVVTGATDGIGRDMSLELARKGLDVLILSRTQEKLDKVKAEIEAVRAGVQVRTVAVDYTNFASGTRQDAAVERVRNAVADLEVAVLVNNVGVSYEYPVMYHDLDDQRAQDLVELNINSTTWMTRLVLPGMVKRKSGAVCSIASVAGTFPGPMLTGYCASKCYVNMFMKALDAEYGSMGISFQCQSPFFVTSKLSKIKRTSLTTPSPAAYAKAAVRAIGYEVESCPYWAHAVQMGVIHSLPESVLVGYTSSLHKKINKAALRKKAREEGQQKKTE